MARDFDNFGHKNAELLRHYIIHEMKKMNKKYHLIQINS